MKINQQTKVTMPKIRKRIPSTVAPSATVASGDGAECTSAGSASNATNTTAMTAFTTMSKTRGFREADE